VGKAGADGED